MKCCQSSQCRGIANVFDNAKAKDELENYRNQGPKNTTLVLLDRINQHSIQGTSLLDIGGGVGAIQHVLLSLGVNTAISVDASDAYSKISEQEALRLGLADRVSYFVGNFIDLAPEIPAADIVTLDRVICCFDDMHSLVTLSASRARKLYGLVFPRDLWWVKMGFRLANFIQKLRRDPFRLFAHPTKSVDAILREKGLERVFHHRGFFWQVLLYQR